MSRYYALVSERAEHRCEYCHAPEAIFNLPFEVEHIVPTSRGGPDEESNLALACRACNLYKSDQTTGVHETTHQVVPLFHPRRDHWESHFRVEFDEGLIQGLSPVGTVTVACLRMNQDVHREARRSWMQLKLYP